MGETITIRRSTQEDARDILRLAALDDRPAPAGDALLAFVDGELRAAMPLERGSAIADPFHLTGDVVELLSFRASQNGRQAA